MSSVAETVRQVLLREAAQKSAQRASRIGAYLQKVLDDGDEPSEALLRQFDVAYAVAERQQLEYMASLVADVEDDD